jgi:hypothetical protein
MGRRSRRLGRRSIRSGAWSSWVEGQQEQVWEGGSAGWGEEVSGVGRGEAGLKSSRSRYGEEEQQVGEEELQGGVGRGGGVS